MSSDILIFGNGYVGKRIQEEIGGVISQRRIITLSDAQEEISRYSPKIIINSIGYIGRNVDDCELNIDKALAANAFVPLILAEAALRNAIKYVHVSSGCIFHYDYERDQPLDEDRPPDFFELFYSRSKIYSELPLTLLAKKFPFLVLRIRVPLDNRKHPKNILNKLISYKDTVADIPNSITYIPDFIQALKYLLEKNARGLYNVVNKGALKYSELLEVYKKQVPDFRYQVIDFKKLNMVRTNLILSTKKLELAGFKVRDIHEVLEECVQGYLKSS